jgi:uncharacterized protein (DUF849 family)
MPFATHAATMGGNVRVGLEDSLFIGRAQLAVSNAQQVTKIRHILEELGHTIATPDEARDILALKGGGQVAF